MTSVCPMGFFCFDKDTLMLLIVAVVIGVSYYIYTMKTKMETTEKVVEKLGEKLEKNMDLEIVQPVSSIVVNKDYERIVNPLLPPERSNPYSPNRVGLPVNIPTRGLSSGFQQVGILTGEGEKVMPLFGEETYPASNMWRYYTNTDQYQSVKLGVRKGSWDCMEERGCKELYNGDSVQVQGKSGEFNVEMYKYDSPKYMPNVIF
jgi:hypothetical protein